jgi:hypothetical protein
MNKRNLYFVNSFILKQDEDTKAFYNSGIEHRDLNIAN